MSGFSFKPVKAEADEFRRRLEESNPWWIHFERPVSRVFCDHEHAASVICADFGMSWAGVGMSHEPVKVATDNPDVDCFRFEYEVETMCVEERYMGGWMEVIRMNGLHGRYRKAGTEKEYRF